MIRNYLNIAVRNILKHKVYSTINVVGLAAGIAATIVIVLFARYELTYDQFHTNSENIYLVYKERVTPNGLQPTYDTWVPMLEQMQSDFPEIENGTRIFFNGGATINIDETTFTENIYYVDPGYFEIFDFPLAQGNNDKPFSNVNSVVISKELAAQFFGNADPIGKSLQIDHQVTYIVTGVLDDYPPNAFWENGIVVPIKSFPRYEEFQEQWGSSFISTLIMLPPNYDPMALEAKFPDFIKSVWDEEVQQRTNFRLLPLHESYNTFVGDNSDSYILLYIALGIIIIASINFMNLSTARSMERAKEIGMRKVMGAQRKQLIAQFLSEAVLMTTTALILGVLAAEMTLPRINEMFAMQLEIPYLDEPISIVILLAFGLVVGFLSGSYPAFYLSNFKILSAIKGLFSKGGGVNLRNSLVVLQFTLSIMLIIGTMVIADQIKYMKGADLAFNKDNLMVIPVSAGDFEDTEGAQERIQTFRNEISRHNSVVATTTSRHVPGRWSGSNAFVRPEGFEGNPLRMRFTYLDAEFFNTYQISLIEGPGFLPDTEGDQRQKVVINQAAMKAFGWETITDKALVLGSSGRFRVEVVGLIEDFNYETLQAEVAPILHFHRVPTNGTHRYITLRTSSDQFSETLEFIESKWDVLGATRDFEYFFVDDDMAQMYALEDRLLTMVSIFSILSIFVTCLGLFGLSSFIIEKRRKEIGIRKVLGASSTGIAILISSNFSKLVIVSFILAAPLAYIIMNQWLDGFAFHTSVSWTVFALAIIVSLGISWLTVSIKSLKAAIANPVDTIREE